MSTLIKFEGVNEVFIVHGDHPFFEHKSWSHIFLRLRFGDAYFDEDRKYKIQFITYFTEIINAPV